MNIETAATDRSSNILSKEYVFVYHDTVDGNEVQIATMTNIVAPEWRYNKWLVKLFQIIIVRIIS